MAILTADSSVDMTDWNFDNVMGGTVTRHTSFQYFLTGLDGTTHYQLTGVGLTYDGSNNLTGGLVTGYKVLDVDGNTLLNVSGFSVNATTVASAIATGDSGGQFEAAVFGEGDNEIHGSSADDVLTDSAGSDTIAAGDGDDLILVTHAGLKTIDAGAGDDTLYQSSETFGTAFNGGAGNDTLIIDRSNNFITMIGDAYKDIETVILTGNAGHNAVLLSSDDAVVAGGSIHIDASALGVGSKLIVEGDAETDGHIDVIAGAGNDAIIGGDFSDSFHLERGGSDHVQGGLGNDNYYMGAALDATDRLDGSSLADSDSVILDGNYAAGLTLGRHTFTDIEQLFVQAGHNYKIIENDHNVAATKSMTIAAINLAGSDKLYFDGSAETDGTFSFNDGSGNDTLIGGAGNDSYTMLGGGTNIVQGGAGNDDASYINTFSVAETIDLGAGTDSLSIAGDLTGTFLATTMVNVETLTLGSFFSYDIVLNDANVAGGKTLTVDAHDLLADDVAKFDGSAETKGRFVFLGGAGDDVLIGGAKADSLNGGAGADMLKGGLGKDTYVYTSPNFSSGREFDTIDGFNFKANKLDVTTAVTGLNGIVSGGQLNDATFDADLAARIDPVHLGLGHAVVFRPTSGDHAGETFLIIDQNGNAGYDAGADLVIKLVNQLHLSHLDVSDFV